MSVTPQEVRDFVVQFLQEALRDTGHAGEELPDEFDLHESGVIDSLGLVEVIVAVDEHFDIAIDFENMDPSELTQLGAFSQFVADQSQAAAVSD